MNRLYLLGGALAVAAVGVALALGPLGASGARGKPPLQRATFAAAAFTPLEYSTHNRNGSSVCPNFVPHNTGADQFQGGAENQSDLDAAHQGSYLENARLPDGAKIDSLSAYIQDFDADDAYVFLLRKKIANGLSPRFTGYQVMASTHSSGAVDDTMRKFTDATVKHATIDNSSYFYFLEMVVCANIEPFAVQVAYR